VSDIAGDLLLAWLILVDLIWTSLVVGFTAYEVFWHGRSKWWFVLVVLFSDASSQYRILRKRFGVSNEQFEP
jgi:hypothetical protein